ncbi:hypothetical protein Tco_0380977 [Tanacetum coccineum]
MFSLLVIDTLLTNKSTSDQECMTRSLTKETFTPFKEPERVFHSTRKIFKTTSLDYSSSPEFNLFSDPDNHGMNGEDAVEHIENFLEIVDLINVPNVSHNQLRAHAFPLSLTGAVNYWRREGDEEVITDNELSNTKDNDLIEEYEIAQIFRIDTDVFRFETPLCQAFKEFNYLSQVDVDVLTKDIPRLKTYEEYKDD